MTRPLPALAIIALALSATSHASAQMILTEVRYDGVLNGGSAPNPLLSLSALSMPTPVLATTDGVSIPFFRAFGDSSTAPVGGTNQLLNYNIMIKVRDVASGEDGTIDLPSSTTGSFDPTGGMNLAGTFFTLQGTFSNGFYEIPFTLGSTDYLVKVPGNYNLLGNPSAMIDVPLIVAVPEPSSMLLAIGPSLFLWRAIRRRRMDAVL